MPGSGPNPLTGTGLTAKNFGYTKSPLKLCNIFCRFLRKTGFFQKIRFFEYTDPILVLSGTKTAFGQEHAFSVCPMVFQVKKDGSPSVRTETQKLCQRKPKLDQYTQKLSAVQKALYQINGEPVLQQTLAVHGKQANKGYLPMNNVNSINLSIFQSDNHKIIGYVTAVSGEK